MGHDAPAERKFSPTGALSLGEGAEAHLRHQMDSPRGSRKRALGAPRLRLLCFAADQGRNSKRRFFDAIGRPDGNDANREGAADGEIAPVVTPPGSGRVGLEGALDLVLSGVG